MIQRYVTQPMGRQNKQAGRTADSFPRLGVTTPRARETLASGLCECSREINFGIRHGSYLGAAENAPRSFVTSMGGWDGKDDGGMRERARAERTTRRRRRTSDRSDLYKATQLGLALAADSEAFRSLRADLRLVSSA